MTLDPAAKILHLTSPGALADFHTRYACPNQTWPTAGRARWGIAWSMVAADYQGILIEPYQWTCRYDMDFYYCWDCASGCIWDLAAIKSVEQLASEPAVTA